MSPKFIPAGWELPPDILERLGKKVGRQRAMEEQDHLLIILHAPPVPGQDEREARVFWRTPNGQWKASKGKGSKGLIEHIAEYRAAIDALEAEEDRARSAEDFFKVLEKANPMARSCRNMHAALQQARDLVPEDADLICARDDAYAAERNAELLVADIRNGFDLYVAKKTEEMTRSGHAMAVAGHRLNTLAALFLPTTALAAVLGMNVPSGLESSPPPGTFLIAVIVGLVMGIAVKSWMDRPVHPS
jgi:Mg2+ and Co2+ transporter CorA